MSDKKTSGYVTGILSFIITVVLVSLTFSNEWNIATQIFLAVGGVTGILTVGCFWRPETFGPIAEELFERLGGDPDNNRPKQSQYKPRNSPQGYTEKGNVTINQNFYKSKKRKRKY